MFSECSTVFVPHSILPVFFSPRSPPGGWRGEPFPGPQGRSEATAQEGPARTEHGSGHPLPAGPVIRRKTFFRCGPRSVRVLCYRCASTHTWERAANCTHAS